MTDHYKAFTLVFDGDIRNFPNPFTTDSPWGKPYALCVWDALEEGDLLREALERIGTDADTTLEPSKQNQYVK